VDPNALPGSWDDPATPRGHIFYIGARNVLMDSHATIKKGSPNATERSREKATKKLAALMAGEVRTAPAQRIDPATKAKLLRAVAAVWEEELAELSKLPAKKRDAEALRRARARLAAPPPTARKKAA
jgi:hypothetical protein